MKMAATLLLNSLQIQQRIDRLAAEEAHGAPRLHRGEERVRALPLLLFGQALEGKRNRLVA